MSANVYEHIEDCTDFQSVIDTLDNLCVKSPNVIFARHLLSTRRQQSGETLDQFLQDLRKLSKDCKFKAVTAEQYREELIRDAFINGLFSPAIRQRLLESDTLSLQIVYDKANSLDLAQKNADTYSMYSALTAATSSIPQPSALCSLVIHVVITVIRKDISGKFVVQTPMQAQQLLSMRILVQ